MNTKNVRLHFVLGAALVLMLNGMFYFSDPAQHLKTSLVADVPIETDENTEEDVYGENIHLKENRNGVEAFYGYKSGDLDAEDMIRYAYERRNSINKKKAGISSRSLRRTNYYAVSTRTRYKSSAPWERTSTLNDKLTKEGIRENEDVVKDPQDTLRSRRTAGVRRLEPAVPKTKVRRYSLRQSQRQYGSAAVTFKNAKEQAEERREKESEVWAPNRTPDTDGNRSRITIKNPDARKQWLEQNQEPEEIKAEVAEQQ